MTSQLQGPELQGPAGDGPAEGSRTMSGVEPMVSLRNIHKEFGHGAQAVHVLKGVDLDVAPGSVTVILGPSGSGKSTLLRCINELEDITAGSVTVGGELMGYSRRADGRKL